MFKWLFGKKATDQQGAAESQGGTPASAPEPATGKTVVTLIRETILAADLKGTEGLELIDALRSIYNTGFSDDAIRKGRQHRSPMVRKYVERFLAEAADLRK